MVWLGSPLCQAAFGRGCRPLIGRADGENGNATWSPTFLDIACQGTNLDASTVTGRWDLSTHSQRLDRAGQF